MHNLLAGVVLNGTCINHHRRRRHPDVGSRRMLEISRALAQPGICWVPLNIYDPLMFEPLILKGHLTKCSEFELFLRRQGHAMENFTTNHAWASSLQPFSFGYGNPSVCLCL